MNVKKKIVPILIVLLLLNSICITPVHADGLIPDISQAMGDYYRAILNYLPSPVSGWANGVVDKLFGPDNDTSEYFSSGPSSSGSGSHSTTINNKFFEDANKYGSDNATALNGYYYIVGSLESIYSSNPSLSSKITFDGFSVLVQSVLENCSSSRFDANYKSKPMLAQVFNVSSTYFTLCVSRPRTYLYLQSNGVATYASGKMDSSTFMVYYSGSFSYVSTNYFNYSKTYLFEQTFSPSGFKLFYSEADYNTYMLLENGGHVPVVNYSPTYAPTSVTVDNRVINYIINNPNSSTIQNYVDNFTNTYTNNGGDINSQEYLNSILELLFKIDYDLLNTGGSGGGDSGGGSGGGSGKDYTQILENIVTHLTEVDGNIANLDQNLAELLALYKENQGNENCPYDFTELETYLDKIWLQCKENQEVIATKLEESKQVQLQTAERLDSIYERLGSLPDYNKILTDILEKLDTISASGSGVYDDSVLIAQLEEISELLIKNNKQNDKIIGRLDNVIDELKDIEKNTHLQRKAKETADKASEVFPFCISWDLARFLNALGAEPVTPVIDVPITVSSIGISEKFTIDLHIFDDFAGKFRVLWVALYAYGLLQFTLKTMKILDD